MKYILIVLIPLIIYITGCKHKENDASKPIITVVEPSAQDTIELSVEPEVHIEFTTLDNVGLSTLQVQLFNASSNLLYATSPAVSDLSVYPFHEHYVPSGISGVTPMKVIITVMDLAGNSVMKEIDFVVRP